MADRTWPVEPTAEQIRRSWSATVSALPIGTRITGQVVDRRPFGVFLRIDGVPNALGLADIGSMPHGLSLPALGAQVSGEVVWHTDHNYQVRIRLGEWLAHD
ncbi:S1 domain-containing protein [Streptomyces siamensis]|uniref:RNA-binding protein n=1 Tax=Streptomyces siamensis TaxID=1274986 RepID=A0ABP9J7P4_9ACTN